MFMFKPLRFFKPFRYISHRTFNNFILSLLTQRLQRKYYDKKENCSLLLATYLKQQVLGGKNTHRIYALEPMSHLQTANNYPDMAAIGYIQQFALLNQIALTGLGGYGSPLYTSNSYPINAS